MDSKEFYVNVLSNFIYIIRFNGFKMVLPICISLLIGYRPFVEACIEANEKGEAHSLSHEAQKGYSL